MFLFNRSSTLIEGISKKITKRESVDSRGAFKRRRRLFEALRYIEHSTIQLNWSKYFRWLNSVVRACLFGTLTVCFYHITYCFRVNTHYVTLAKSLSVRLRSKWLQIQLLLQWPIAIQVKGVRVKKQIQQNKEFLYLRWNEQLRYRNSFLSLSAYFGTLMTQL